MQILKFSGSNIPVYKVAEAMKKNKMAVRMAIEKGTLPIGYPIPSADKEDGKPSVYISPKLLYEVTGILIDGEYELLELSGKERRSEG